MKELERILTSENIEEEIRSNGGIEYVKIA